MRGRLFFCVFFSIFVFVFFTSCHSKSDSSVLDEVEFHIDEKLASISNDGSGNIWVGSETGDLYNFRNEKLTHYDLKEDIIYKAILHSSTFGDSTLWVACRNSGLQIWDLKKLKKLKTYTIENRLDKYSPYDIVFDKNKNVYVATNFGFYKTNIADTTSVLSLLHPSEDKLKEESNDLYIYRNLYPYQDSLILGATLDGIKIHNVNTSNTQTLLKGINIEHVTVYNDTIFATAQDFLYRISSSNDIIRSSVTNQPKMFFRDRNNNNFLVSSEHLMMTTDFKHFNDVKLNRKVPTNTNVHNLMVNDVNLNYSLLVSENAICRIANNLNILSGKKIQASCSNNDGNIYLLTASNELYIQSAEEKTANWVFSFDLKDPIIWIDVTSDNELFLLSNSNTLYKINLNQKWYKNLIDSPRKIFQTSSKITRSYLYKTRDGHKCLIGTQDGLFYLSNDSIKLIPEFENLYITSLRKDDESGYLYISTLNDGIYSSNFNFDEIEKIPETSQISFIKDIIVNNGNIIVLTSQGLKLIGKENFIRVKGGTKIFSYRNNTLFLILQKGLQKYKIENDSITKVDNYFEDIKLNPSACFISNGQLILGTDIGAISTSPYKINTSNWILFGEVINIESLSIIVLAGVLLLIVLIFLSRLFYSEKQKGKDNQLLKMREDLVRRINDIEVFLNQPHIDYSDLPSKILEIKKYLDTLNLENESEENKINIKYKLEEISLQIGDINRKLSIHFWINLNEQKDRLLPIKHFEAKELVIKINHIEKTDNINIIYNSINGNQVWLNKYQEIIDFINKQTQLVCQCLIIEGVNKELSDTLISTNSVKDNTPLSELVKIYDRIKTLIERLNQDNVIEQLRNKIEQLDLDSEAICADSAIKDSIKEAHRLISLDNAKVLILLKNIEGELNLSKILQDIKDVADIFKKNVDDINKKHSKLGTLNENIIQEEITNSNKNYIKEINNYISAFYNYLSNNDLDILNNTLKITNTSSQNAKVLALLLSDKNMKRTIIPLILGIYGNLNPVISRIINDRIKPNIDIIRAHLENKESVFVTRILEILKQ